MLLEEEDVDGADLKLPRCGKRKCLPNDNSTAPRYRGKAKTISRKVDVQIKDVVLKEDCCKPLYGLRDSLDSVRLVNEAHGKIGGEKNSHDFVDAEPLDGNNVVVSDGKEIVSGENFDFQSADVDYRNFLIGLLEFSEGVVDSQSVGVEYQSFIKTIEESQDSYVIRSKKRNNVNVDDDVVAMTSQIIAGVEDNENDKDRIDEIQDGGVIKSMNTHYLDVGEEVVARTTQIIAGVKDNNDKACIDEFQNGDVIKSMNIDYPDASNDATASNTQIIAGVKDDNIDNDCIDESDDDDIIGSTNMDYVNDVAATTSPNIPGERDNIIANNCTDEAQDSNINISINRDRCTDESKDGNVIRSVNMDSCSDESPDGNVIRSMNRGFHIDESQHGNVIKSINNDYNIDESEDGNAIRSTNVDYCIDDSQDGSAIRSMSRDYRIDESQDGNVIRSMNEDGCIDESLEGNAIRSINEDCCIDESQQDNVIRSMNTDFGIDGYQDGNLIRSMNMDFCIDESPDGNVIRSMSMAFVDEDTDVATTTCSALGIDDINTDKNLDPHYKMFLQNLKEDGKSYLLEINEGNGKSLRIKYEDEDGDRSFDGFSFRTLQCLNDSLKEKHKEPVTVSSIKKNRKNVRPHNLNGVLRKEIVGNSESSRNILGRQKKKTSNVSVRAIEKTKRSLGLDKNVRRRCADTISGRSDRQSIKRTTLGSHHLGKGGHMVDSGTECTKTVIIQPKNEPEDELSSDSEVLVVDVDPYHNGDDTPFITSKSYVADEVVIGDTGNYGSAKHSHFRKNLMDILRKPYEHREYRDLLQKITYRRPKVLERRLRSGIEKAYKVNSSTISYLDQHSDFAAKMNLVKGDRLKVLNLMRGFNYWLQNVVHEGAFRPWLDSSCLDVLPRQ